MTALEAMARQAARAHRRAATVRAALVGALGLLLLALILLAWPQSCRAEAPALVPGQVCDWRRPGAAPVRVRLLEPLRMTSGQGLAVPGWWVRVLDRMLPGAEPWMLAAADLDGCRS